MMMSAATAQANAQGEDLAAGGERFGVVLAVVAAASAAFNTTLNGDILLLVGAVVAFILKPRWLIPLLFVVMLAAMVWQNPLWWDDTRVGVMVGLCVALAVVSALRAGVAAFRAEGKEQQARFALWSLLFAASAFFGLAALLLSRIFGLPLHKEIFALFLTAAFAPVVIIFSRRVSISLGAGLALFVSLCGFTQLVAQRVRVEQAPQCELERLVRTAKTEQIRERALKRLFALSENRMQMATRYKGILKDTGLLNGVVLRLLDEAERRGDLTMMEKAVGLLPDNAFVCDRYLRFLEIHGYHKRAVAAASRMVQLIPGCIGAWRIVVKNARETENFGTILLKAVDAGYFPTDLKQELLAAALNSGRWDLVKRVVGKDRAFELRRWQGRITGGLAIKKSVFPNKVSAGSLMRVEVKFYPIVKLETKLVLGLGNNGLVSMKVPHIESKEIETQVPVLPSLAGGEYDLWIRGCEDAVPVKLGKVKVTGLQTLHITEDTDAIRDTARKKVCLLSANAPQTVRKWSRWRSKIEVETLLLSGYSNLIVIELRSLGRIADFYRKVPCKPRHRYQLRFTGCSSSNGCRLVVHFLPWHSERVGATLTIPRKWGSWTLSFRTPEWARELRILLEKPEGMSCFFLCQSLEIMEGQ